MPITRPLAGKRILVVEDHEHTREIFQATLTHAGGDVMTAASPEHALTVLSTATVDAVITDLGFGADPMAGTRMLAAVRPRPDRCPVIAVTGRKELENDLRVMGFDAVLVKPVDPFDLLAVVVRVVAP
jgi:DNA-binding response OmpR family regulator